MTYRPTLPLALILALVATAEPAHAEDRAALRDALETTATSTPDSRLVRHGTPAWAEIATNATACAPACDPCCLPFPAPCGDPCAWHGVISLTTWTPGISGDMTVRGRRAEVDSTPMDVIENLDKLESMFQGRATLYRGKWGFTIGGMTARFEDSLDLEERRATVTGGIGLDLAEGYVSYCLHRCPLTVGCNPRCEGFSAYEVYVGARYVSLELELDRGPGIVAPAASVRRVKSWVDPIVGAKAIWELGNGWGFELQGDIGGFGIGSDFAWNLRAGVHYRPWRLVSFGAGFKVVDFDYSDGSGTDRFVFDAALWGPYLALNFHF